MKAAPRHIALVAHDNKKQDLIEWAVHNSEALEPHTLYATGTTGRMVAEALGRDVIRMQSGPLGGDQQIGARIAEGTIDMLLFFWDPLEPMPHDPDVKALLRIAVVWDIPVACNRISADLMVTSPLMARPDPRQRPDYSDYTTRSL